jgi:hypothetical protein
MQEPGKPQGNKDLQTAKSRAGDQKYIRKQVAIPFGFLSHFHSIVE